MKKLLALLFVMLIASCGGGSSPAGGNGAGPGDSLIRYQGSWRGYRFSSTGPTPPATLTLQAVPGQASISTQAVARVEVQLGQAAPVVLAAANSTDSAGRPQYVFDFGQLTDATRCSGSALQIGITVVDVTGFAYTKKVATCTTSDFNFGAFSDYGTTPAQFSYTATAPISAFITRNSPTGYVDTLLPTAQTSFSAALPSVEGDALMLVTNRPLPAGSRVQSRIEGGGGAFAQTTLAAAYDLGQPFLTLLCCGPRPAGTGSVDVELRIQGFSTVNPYPPDATYTYRFAISDPATGAVVGSQSGTTYGTAFFPLQVRRGHVIEMDVTPNDPRASVQSGVRLGPAGSGGDSATAFSNEPGTPARFKVFCCSP